MVEYYPTKEYFEQLSVEQEDFDLTEHGVQTRFVGSNGWRIQTQSLYQAEQKYSSFGNEHDSSHWNNLGLENVDDAYLDENTPDEIPETNIETWTVENAGVTNTQVLSDPDEADEESIFDGGFAGKCSEGERWQYDDENERWECSGDFGWEHLAFLPDFSDESTAALAIPHTNFMDPAEVANDFDTTFDTLPFALQDADMTDDYGEITGIETGCWPGELDEREDAETVIEGSIDDLDTDTLSEPLVLHGELDHNGTYSCSWGYPTEGGQTYDEIRGQGTVIEMHNEPEDELEEELVDSHMSVLDWEESYGGEEEFLDTVSGQTAELTS